MSYFLPFSLSFILSLVLTGFAQWLGSHYQIAPRPRRRDVHKKPMPRFGGVAIFFAFFLVSFVFFNLVQPTLTFDPGVIFGIDKHLVGIWLAAALITFAMLADDLRSLLAWQKLSLQILAVVVVIASGIGIDKLSNPFGNAIDLNSVYIPILTYKGIVYHFSLWSDLLTFLWLVGMMNVINFVDGVDGLAGGISAIAAFVIFVLALDSSVNQPATALLSIILAGAAAGFLIWNFPPAKIFMGDSGSMFLGFILGILAIISGGKLATAFLVLGFPIIDGILVAGGRMLRGENPLTTPDKTHLHHRFLRAGFSAKEAIIALYLISAAFGLLALKFKTFNKIITAFVLIILLVVLIKILNLLARKNG